MDSARELLQELTLEEKASLCSGKDFWKLKGIDRLGIPSVMVTDGPHGLRKQSGDTDHLGLTASVPATCFPTAAATAGSWDEDLMREMGEALAEECLQEDVAVILGPGANIKRSPLCGRNFEYQSEDPYLTGRMAAALIKGIQSKGIGASLKHYALNNQETRRMTVDSVVDERAEREIYLKGFEIAVKEAQPWTVMCSYNRVEGVYLSDHKRLLTDILKEEWGHTGLVVTDWGATNDRVEGIRAGMELEMPSSQGVNDAKIVAAVKDGSLSEELLDRAVIRILELIRKAEAARQEDYRYDIEAHRQLARRVAAASSVLLKNDGVLPLEKDVSIAVVGEFAKTPRFQGAGSSFINPHFVDTACDELEAQGITFTYSDGYDLKSGEPDQSLIEAAVKTARDADVAVVFAGLPALYESEGFDRDDLSLPESHNALIAAVAEANPRTVVVLQNGAAVEMPWVGDVAAILESYLGGGSGGPATVDVLFGDVNPSAKLAETFPVSLEDNPAYLGFPGKVTAEYRESIYVGYRYFDTAGKDVLFPFGHGLSYTRFEYSGLTVTERDGGFDVSLMVKNVGDVDGAEIVQVYVKNSESVLFKAEKELRAFEKVQLAAGEDRTVGFRLDPDAFSYYNVNISDWHTEAGKYEVQIGASSRDIRLAQTVSVAENRPAKVPDYRDTAAGYYDLKNAVLDIGDADFGSVLGRELPPSDLKPGRPFSANSTLGDTQGTFVGRRLMKMIKKSMSEMVGDEVGEDDPNAKMLDAMVADLPLRAVAMLGGEQMPKHFLNGTVALLNGKYITGLRLLRKK